MGSKQAEAPPYDTARHDEYALQVEGMLQEAISQSLLGSDEVPAAEFIDVDGLKAQLARCRAALPSTDACSIFHAYAIKANPLAAILAIVREAGFGAECASPEEFQHALACGFAPLAIVYDAPAKTARDLRLLLRSGCRVNLDSEAEVRRVARLMMEEGILVEPGTIGLRLNPMLGPGTIAETSTATAESKFGVPLVPGPQTEALLQLFVEEAPWLAGVHCHVGSQGCPLVMLVAGAAAAARFAAEVNRRAARQQITFVDVGGGLSVDYGSDLPFQAGADFAAYARELRSAAPELFTGGWTIVTEFGRSLVAKAGVTASVVEGVKHCGGSITAQTPTAILHVGANMFVREAYCPQRWFHRITVHRPDGKAKTTSSPGDIPLSDGCNSAKGGEEGPIGGPTSSKEAAAGPCGGAGAGSGGKSTSGLLCQTLAGPLCFSGDMVARKLPLPPIAERDLAVIHDTGGYTSSMYSCYNSRTPPPVFGFQRKGGGSGEGSIEFVLLRKRTLEQTIAFWK